MKKTYLECGKVLSAHGVRGLVKVEPWCDSPKVLSAQKRIFLAKKDGTYEERKLLSASVAANTVLLHIEGIETREDAIAMKNTVLYLTREDIPCKDGACLLEDLIGLSVMDAVTGKVYGTVTDVDDTPAGRLYTVKTDGGERLLPAVREFIKETNPDVGILVSPIPGLFDDNDL